MYVGFLGGIGGWGADRIGGGGPNYNLYGDHAIYSVASVGSQKQHVSVDVQLTETDLRVNSGTNWPLFLCSSFYISRSLSRSLFDEVKGTLGIEPRFADSESTVLTD